MFDNPEESRRIGKRWTKTRQDKQKIKWQTDLNPTMSIFTGNVNETSVGGKKRPQVEIQKL